MNIQKAAVTIPLNAQRHDLIDANRFLRDVIGSEPDVWEWALLKKGIKVSASRDKHDHRYPRWLTGNVTAEMVCSECEFKVDPVAIAIEQFDRHKCK